MKLILNDIGLFLVCSIISFWVVWDRCKNGNRSQNNFNFHDKQTVSGNSDSSSRKDRRIGSKCRIAIEEDYFVVLYETSPGVFHGHVRTWGQLEPAMRYTLQQAGLVSKSGEIL